MKKILSLSLYILCVLNVSGQQNTCITANAFCSSSQYTFPNATSGTAPSGPNYGCLGDVPAPIWYYMEIGTAGTIRISISQTSGDIDFAMWGPFTSLSQGCSQIMSGTVAPIQSSYSINSTETIGIGVQGGSNNICQGSTSSGQTTPPAAQVGQVYIILLTNYTEDPGTISFNQTSGTGSADCSIVEPCAIDNFTTNISACSVPTQTYSLSGTIAVTNPPDVGQLIVRDCNGVQTVVASAPFNASSYPYSLTGLNANGAACSVEAYFSDQAGSCSALLTYTAPSCGGCSISSPGVTVGACQSNGTYAVSGTLNFNNPPATGTLIVSTTCGGNQTFNAPFNSPINYSLTGLPANGASCDLRAYFSDDTACELIQSFTAPNIVTPTFDPIGACHNATAPILPTTSLNGIAGTWSPATINTSSVGVTNHTFTPNAGECAEQVILGVTIENLPNASAGNLAIITCENPSVQLNGSSSTSGVTYSWAGPGIVSGGDTQTPTVNQTGAYTLTVTTAFGCSNTSLVSVIEDVYNLPIDAGAPQTLTCASPSVQLNGSSSMAGLNYSWSGPGIVSGGGTQTPTVNLPGTYTVTVTHPANGCTGTATVVVDEDNAPFDTDAGSDQIITCTETAVQLSGSASIPNVSFSWSGPGIISGQTSPNPIVNQVGIYTLTTTNLGNGCTSSANVSVTSNIVLPISDFTADTLLGCQGLNVNFTAAVDSSMWEYQWNFGNGNTGTGSTAVNQYNNSGCYAVTLTVTDLNNNCSSSTTLADSICILSYPDALFTARPHTLIVDRESLVTFINSSTNANGYIWSLPDGSEQYEEGATFDFKGYEPGSYSVYLLVSNDGLCFDSVSIQIRIKEDVLFYVPNTFTPDGDEFNQSFRPIITSGIDIYNYTFKIYNRWGEIIWESNDPSVGWDGTYNSRPIQQGTYTWSMEFKLTDVDDRMQFRGHLNLLR